MFDPWLFCLINHDIFQLVGIRMRSISSKGGYVMKYRVLFLTFLLVVCFCSCGPQKLTRDLATKLIKESETFQKKRDNIEFHKTGFEKMKNHEMLEMIIVGEGFFKKREIQAKNEYQNIFSLGYIKSYTSHKKYIIMLKNPVPIKLTEVTGITDAATGKGVKEAQFVWEYSELPSLLRRFVIKGGKGTAYMRLYDDGWRTDEIKLETTDEPIQLTKEQIEQEKKELKEIADRIAAEKERERAEKERKRLELIEHPRVTARVSNADDKAILYVNDREAIKTEFGKGAGGRSIGRRPGDSGWVDITSYFQPGKNELRFWVWNASGCCDVSGRFEVKKNDVPTVSRNFQRREETEGVKYNEKVFLSLPK